MISKRTSTAKNRVNTALARVSGYHLTRVKPETPVDTVEDARQTLHELREQIAAERARLEQLKQERLRPRPFPADFDEPMREVIKAVRGRTMTDRPKMFTLISAVRYIVAHHIPGDVVECGVWRGGSMQAVARELVRLGETDRHLYLFDTFEGMPPPSAADVRWDGQSASDLLEAHDKSRHIWAAASLEDVQAGFEPIGYPADKIHYIEGRVEDTVPEHVPEVIALLRLDTDWYESSLHELDHMYDRLVPGGVLLLDDYGYWEGQRRATDEWLARTNEPLMLFRMGQGRAGVKPRR